MAHNIKVKWQLLWMRDSNKTLERISKARGTKQIRVAGNAYDKILGSTNHKAHLQ